MNDLLFKEQSAKPLCLFRLAWGAYLICYYLGSLWIYRFYYGVVGFFFLPEYNITHSPIKWTVFDWIQQPNLIFPLMYALALISAVGVMVGRYTRVSSFVAWVCACSFMNPLSYGFGGGDTLTRIISLLLMVCSFAGFTALHYSLDARQKPAAEEIRRVPVWGYRVFQVQLCVVYFFSGLAKIGIVEWRNGTAMDIWLQHVGSWVRYDLTWILEYPALCAALTLSVWVFELILFPVGVWFCATRRWVLGLGLLFQLFLIFGMRVFPFGPVMLVVYLCFLTQTEVEQIESCFRDVFRRISSRFTGP